MKYSPGIFPFPSPNYIIPTPPMEEGGENMEVLSLNTIENLKQRLHTVRKLSSDCASVELIVDYSQLMASIGLSLNRRKCLDLDDCAVIDEQLNQLISAIPTPDNPRAHRILRQQVEALSNLSELL